MNPLNYLTYMPEPRWRTFYVKRYLEFPSVFEENKGTYKINSLHPICPASGSKEKVSGSDHTENETGIYHLASSPEMPQIELELLNEQV